MGKKSKTPQAPDYLGGSIMQAQLNKDAWNSGLLANRPNQSNQFANLTWSQDPVTGQWTQNTQLNQPQQDIFDLQQGNQKDIAGKVGGMLGGLDTSQIDFSGAPAMGQVGGFDQRATDLYNQLAQPQLDRQRAAKEAQMAAMGMSLGSGRAYDTQQELLNDSENRSAMMAAQAGIQQGNQMFQQQNALRQQEIGNILSQRQANLGQLSGLMGMTQQVGLPQFNQFAQMEGYKPADIMGAMQGQYGADLNKTNAANADKSNTMQTVGTVASIAAMAF